MRWDKPKGQRLHKRFMSVTTFEDYWWCGNSWLTWEESRKLKLPASTHARCRSIKAFKRHLKRHGIKGVKYFLVSRFVGYNVEAYAK